jgi:hypothetical protein
VTGRRDSSDEIEITAAMIAAGVSAFLDFDSRFEGEADAVADIFRAMMEAREVPAEVAADTAPQQHPGT